MLVVVCFVLLILPLSCFVAAVDPFVPRVLDLIPPESVCNGSWPNNRHIVSRTLYFSGNLPLPRYISVTFTRSDGAKEDIIKPVIFKGLLETITDGSSKYIKCYKDDLPSTIDIDRTTGVQCSEHEIRYWYEHNQYEKSERVSVKIATAPAYQKDKNVVKLSIDYPLETHFNRIPIIPPSKKTTDGTHSSKCVFFGVNDVCGRVNGLYCNAFTSYCVGPLKTPTCKCLKGFAKNVVPNSDKKDFPCEDIDECALNMHSCNLMTEYCKNIPGSFMCRPKGREKQPIDLCHPWTHPIPIFRDGNPSAGGKVTVWCQRRINQMSDPIEKNPQQIYTNQTSRGFVFTDYSAFNNQPMVPKGKVCRVNIRHRGSKMSFIEHSLLTPKPIAHIRGILSKTLGNNSAVKIEPLTSPAMLSGGGVFHRELVECTDALINSDVFINQRSGIRCNSTHVTFWYEHGQSPTKFYYRVLIIGLLGEGAELPFSVLDYSLVSPSIELPSSTDDGTFCEEVQQRHSVCQRDIGTDCSGPLNSKCAPVSKGKLGCVCLDGFRLSKDGNCTDFDECAHWKDNDCMLDHQCVNRLGTYSCEPLHSGINQSCFMNNRTYLHGEIRRSSTDKCVYHKCDNGIGRAVKDDPSDCKPVTSCPRGGKINKDDFCCPICESDITTTVWQPPTEAPCPADTVDVKTKFPYNRGFTRRCVAPNAIQAPLSYCKTEMGDAVFITPATLLDAQEEDFMVKIDWLGRSSSLDHKHKTADVRVNCAGKSKFDSFTFDFLSPMRPYAADTKFTVSEQLKGHLNRFITPNYESFPGGAVGVECYSDALIVWAERGLSITSVTITAPRTGVVVPEIGRNRVVTIFGQTLKNEDNLCVRKALSDECFISSLDCKAKNGYCHRLDPVDQSQTADSYLFQCKCNPGTRDVSGGTGTSCISTPICSKGLRVVLGSGKETYCEDINECKENTHACKPSQGCVNRYLSYKCVDQCPAGYIKDTNGTGECLDVDECSFSTHGCDPKTTTCKNTPGSYVCDCKDNINYILAKQADHYCTKRRFEYRLLDPAKYRCVTHSVEESAFLVKARVDVTNSSLYDRITPVGCLHLFKDDLISGVSIDYRGAIKPYIVSGDAELEVETLIQYVSLSEDVYKQHFENDVIFVPVLTFDTGCRQSFRSISPDALKTKKILKVYPVIGGPAREYLNLNSRFKQRRYSPVPKNVDALAKMIGPSRPASNIPITGCGVTNSKSTLHCMNPIMWIIIISRVAASSFK